ncbi:MAG: dihydroorotase, partial [Pseudomonadota bacterium]
MSPRIEIRNSHIIDPAQNRSGYHTLYIADGHIAAWNHPPLGWVADQTIDAPNWITCPGLVDLSARLNIADANLAEKNDKATALSAGITSMVCPPDRGLLLDSPQAIEQLLQHHSDDQPHVYPLGALTQKLEGHSLTDMALLTQAGCIGFSQANTPLLNTRLLYQAMQYAATFDYVLWLAPQDAPLSQGGVAHDGHVATRLGLPAIPASAEVIALHNILTLMRQTNARVHICRLSSAEGVNLIRQAKAEGLPITADISIHHLHLCDIDIGYFNTHCHLSPPLRSTRDRDALHAGLEDETIDAICSDHTPLPDSAKQCSFLESVPGATSIELLLSLTLHWANTHNIEFPQALSKITSKPAEVLGLTAGNLSIGAPADLCLFDPDAIWEVNRSTL